MFADEALPLLRTTFVSTLAFVVSASSQRAMAQDRPVTERSFEVDLQPFVGWAYAPHSLTRGSMGVDAGLRLSRFLEIAVDGTWYAPFHSSPGGSTPVNESRWSSDADLVVYPLAALLHSSRTAGGAAKADARGIGRAAARAWLRWIGLSGLLAAVSLGSAWSVAAHVPPRADSVAVVSPKAVEHEQEPVFAGVRLAGHSHAERAAPPAFAVRARVGEASAAPDPGEDAELTRVTEAKQALRRGDPATALRALDAHAKEFSRGIFREEAAALRVQALVAARRFAEGRAAADAFETAYPKSAYRVKTEGQGR